MSAGATQPSNGSGGTRECQARSINFPKMAHIAKLIYMTGAKVADLDHAPARDNKGPRVGKGTGGKIGGTK